MIIDVSDNLKIVLWVDLYEKDLTNGKTYILKVFDIDSPTMVAILTRQKKSVKESDGSEDDAAEVKLPCAIIGYNITFLDVVQKRKLLSQKYFFNVHSEML